MSTHGHPIHILNSRLVISFVIPPSSSHIVTHYPYMCVSFRHQHQHHNLLGVCMIIMIFFFSHTSHYLLLFSFWLCILDSCVSLSCTQLRQKEWNEGWKKVYVVITHSSFSFCHSNPCHFYATHSEVEDKTEKRRVWRKKTWNPDNQVSCHRVLRREREKCVLRLMKPNISGCGVYELLINKHTVVADYEKWRSIIRHSERLFSTRLYPCFVLSDCHTVYSMWIESRRERKGREKRDMRRNMSFE